MQRRNKVHHYLFGDVGEREQGLTNRNKGKEDTVAKWKGRELKFINCPNFYNN